MEKDLDAVSKETKFSLDTKDHITGASKMVYEITREQIKAALDELVDGRAGVGDWFMAHKDTIRALLSGNVDALRAACPDRYAVVTVADFLCFAPEDIAEHPAEKGNG